MTSLSRSGSILSAAVAGAFRKVDRGTLLIRTGLDGEASSSDHTRPHARSARAAGHFIDPPESATEEVRYINTPFRNGVQHLSAPGIYATVLESFELIEGQSFLNVCSGTGYFSALAAQLLGTKVRASPARPDPASRWEPDTVPNHKDCLHLTRSLAVAISCAGHPPRDRAARRARRSRPREAERPGHFTH